MQNNQHLYREPQVNQRIVERLTHMLHECQFPFIKQLKTAYKRVQEVAAADPMVDSITTIDCGSLPARLVAGCNTRSENLPTRANMGGVVIDSTFSLNFWDIYLCLQAPANNDHSFLGLQ
jgi:hypothetical protein